MLDRVPQSGAPFVIEDSVSGLSAGRAAGMTVWTVNNHIPLSGAHRHCPSLEDAAADILQFVT